MVQIKFFELSSYEKANEFMKKYPPRGEKGLIVNTSGIAVIYEDGDPMSTVQIISKLQMDLGNHRERIVDHKVEKAVGELQLAKGKERLAILEEERDDLSYDDKAENSRKIKLCQEIIGGAENIIAMQQGSIEQEEIKIQAVEENIRYYIADHNMKK